MMNMQNNITLARHIKWVIGNRIILCLLLVSVVVLTSSFTDIVGGYRQINDKLTSESKILAEYIVAQSLIDNKQAIAIKINELNEANSQEKVEWRTNAIAEPDIRWVFPFSLEYSYPVRDHDGVNYGEIDVRGSYLFSNSILLHLVAKFFLLLGFSALIFILLYPLSNRIPKQLFIAPIMNLLAMLKNRSIASSDNGVILPVELREIQAKIIELMNELTENARKVAFGQMAAQVAHDIRSPLSTLDIVIKNTAAIPEDERILMHSAIAQMHDMADHLLIQHREDNINQIEDERKIVPEYIADLILGVVSEKRVQNRNQKISIEADIREDAYFLFAAVSASSLIRVISNLLDNALESIYKDSGLIRVSLCCNQNNLKITIQDNGCGIASDVLHNIREGKVTSQKRKGNGLGLSYSMQTIKNVFGGQFDIQSSVDTGTRIDISLPRAIEPRWFASKLIIAPASTIVVLDDDETIHQVWQKCFTGYDIAELIEFYSSDELLTWYQSYSSESVLFLIDYELAASEKTGLDVIEQLNIAARSYLVTNRYEDLELRQRCDKLGLRLIPKLFVSHIPIVMVSKNDLNPDLIFIDDDIALINAWLLRAKMTGKIISTYQSIDEFKRVVSQFKKKDIPIYIDSDLGDAMKGQDFARLLYEDGFKDIYLATGYLNKDFPEMHWIREVVGKTPPF
jgi:signal transduction histidine kinase